MDEALFLTVTLALAAYTGVIVLTVAVMLAVTVFSGCMPLLTRDNWGPQTAASSSSRARILKGM